MINVVAKIKISSEKIFINFFRWFLDVSAFDPLSSISSFDLQNSFSEIIKQY
jgi:hypothetical protein